MLGANIRIGTRHLDGPEGGQTAIPEGNLGKFMQPDDVADIIINNIKERKNINVPQVVIEMH